MPILNPKPKLKREILRISVDELLYQEIQSYCQWVGIERSETYIELAAQYVLMHDKDWKRHQRALKKGSQAKDSMAKVMLGGSGDD